MEASSEDGDAAQPDDGGLVDGTDGDGPEAVVTDAPLEGSGCDESSTGACPALCAEGVCLQAIAIATAEFHTCALLSNASVYCWGDNEFGSLGNGTITPPSPSPVPVELMAGVTALAGGGSQTCALRSDGTVWCWGNYGDFDWSTDSGILDTPTPLKIEGVSDAKAIAAGDSHACALLSDQTIRCWGHNFSGQLGDRTMNDSSSAVAVVEVSGATSIAVGESQACATLSNGSVSCWGTNGEGELGDGTGVDSPTPVKVAGLTNAVALAGGWDHTCALLADATVQCWGDNDFGQLGTSATGPDTCPSGTTCSKVPVPVSGLMGATRVVAGQNFTCALQSGGSVACWGANVDGELGGGTDMGPQLCAGEPCSPSNHDRAARGHLDRVRGQPLLRPELGGKHRVLGRQQRRAAGERLALRPRGVRWRPLFDEPSRGPMVNRPRGSSPSWTVGGVRSPVGR
jgi:alpha-tubulin suppressor-like RCC1 family protein